MAKNRKSGIQKKVLEPQNEVIISVHEEYLYLEKLSYKLFRNDGHEPIRIYINNYRAPGKYVNQRNVRIPPSFSCSYARSSEVRDIIIQTGVIALDDNPKAVDDIYPWFKKKFSHIFRPGAKGVWKDIVIPPTLKGFRSRNISNGRICLFKKVIKTKNEFPIMILEKVDGQDARYLKEADLWEAVGDMANRRCSLKPKEIVYEFVCGPVV